MRSEINLLASTVSATTVFDSECVVDEASNICLEVEFRVQIFDSGREWYRSELRLRRSGGLFLQFRELRIYFSSRLKAESHLAQEYCSGALFAALFRVVAEVIQPLDAE